MPLSALWLSYHGFGWVEGNVVNAVDPMGLQGGQPPQPEIIEETIETALQLSHEEIIPEVRLRDILIETLENNDIRVTTEVIDETMPTLMFRLNALGYAVQATTFGIPYESRGRIGNTYEHTLGTADHLSSWSSYPELDPTQLWESLNNTCVSTQPIPGVIPLPPFAPDDTGIGAGSQKRRDRDDDEARIDVRSYVVDNRIGQAVRASHLYIIYSSDSTGEILFRGGPEFGFLNPRQAGQSSRCPNISNSDTRGAVTALTPHSYGTVYNGIVAVDTKAGPSRTVLKGEDARSKYACLISEYERINKACQAYKPQRGPNSNTVISTMLRKCGIPRKKPRRAVNVPGWDHPDI